MVKRIAQRVRYCLASGCVMRTRFRYELLLVLSFMFCAFPALAMEYQSSSEFLAQTFKGTPPPPKVLWLTGAVGQSASTILGHPPGALRTRYWVQNGRSAWILEEIGKEQPITVGLVIHQGRIENVKVLTYRESRGDEVRHDFFTRQFTNISLKPDTRLDKNIDGISGATLSVQALSKLARLALYLHQQTGN